MNIVTDSILRPSVNILTSSILGNSPSRSNSTPFSPNLIPGLVLWFDGNDPDGNGIKPIDGSSVALWVDKSTLVNDAYQMTGVNQPLFISNFYNGLGSVKGNGLSFFLTIDFSASYNTDDLTMMCSLKTENWDSFASPISSRTGPVTQGYNIYQFGKIDPLNDTWEGWTGDGSDTWQAQILGNIDFTKNVIISLRISGGMGQWYINGIAVGTPKAYVKNTSGIGNIFSVEGPNLFFPGTVSEWVVYNNTLSDNDFTLLNQYGITRWGA